MNEQKTAAAAAAETVKTDDNIRYTVIGGKMIAVSTIVLKTANNAEEEAKLYKTVNAEMAKRRASRQSRQSKYGVKIEDIL